MYFFFLAINKAKELPSMINVGLGYDFTINEYYKKIADCIGYSGEFIHELDKPSGMRRKLLNIDKAKILGWQPKVSMEEGIRKTYQYYLALNN